MSVIRVQKNKNYTTMSNFHFKEKDMSLKAKGLLSLMLSLPDDWDYSIKGLVAICKENETSIKSSLSELKKFGYLEIIKIMPNESKIGRFEYVYNIYEKPKQEGKKQGVENLPLEILEVENQAQLNTNNKYINNNIIYNTKYKTYGKYKRIKLTGKEYKRLCDDFGEERIKRQITSLDEYLEINNNKNKYKNFNLVLRKSLRENWFKQDSLPKWFDKAVDKKLNPYEEKEMKKLLEKY